MRARTCVLAPLLGLWACAESAPRMREDVCDEHVASSRLQLARQDRSTIGSPASYPADLSLRADDAKLAASQRRRREAAWGIVARVLQPTPLARGLPNVGAPTVPAFQTWYSKEELVRAFRAAYAELSPEARAARAPFSDTALDAVLPGPAAESGDPSWSVELYQMYLAAVTDAARVAGLGGVYRVGYSEAAARHLLGSYPEILDCESPSSGPAGAAPQASLPRAGKLSPCRKIPGSIESRTPKGSMDRDAGGEPTNEDKPEAPSGMGRGGGPTSGEGGGAPVGDSAWAPCLAGPFPREAVLVKADYRRADFGQTLPVYDTGARSLRHKLSDATGWDWGSGDAVAQPDEKEIFTLVLPNGNRFRLAALHIMSKELDHWIWVTLWWSPRPNEDFGADRPTTITGVFSHYKMCVATSFTEMDRAPDGGYLGELPSLGEALAATHGGLGAPTFCSNPYLERGAGNALTNCMGCHQHAGTTTSVSDILSKEEKYPENGRAQILTAFPHDYAFPVSAGDRLAAMMLETETHYADR